MGIILMSIFFNLLCIFYNNLAEKNVIMNAILSWKCSDNIYLVHNCALKFLCFSIYNCQTGSDIIYKRQIKHCYPKATICYNYQCLSYGEWKTHKLTQNYNTWKNYWTRVWKIIGNAHISCWKQKRIEIIRVSSYCSL